MLQQGDLDLEAIGIPAQTRGSHDTMQPGEITESMAAPVRPSSANTNFAGGACGWCVRIGHAGS